MTRRPPPLSTPWQMWTCVVAALLEDARDDLAEAEYEAFISHLVDRVGAEFARLVVGAHLRGERAGEEPPA